MRILTIALLIGTRAIAAEKDSNTASPLRSVLLQELRETHNQKNWFVSEKEAVAGLTGEQAAWTDGKNHSAGQLVDHMNYWNSANLARLKHQPAPKTPNNDATFSFEPKNWQTSLSDFDRIMTELEQFVQSCDEPTLVAIAPNVARMAQHNAYHLAEIVTSRKKQGTWDPENGVK
jgi:DinB superfamily